MLFWRGRTPGVLVGAFALAMIAGCTSTPSPTSSTTSAPTPAPTTSTTPIAAVTPSATPTMSAEQLAAIATIDDFAAANERIGADPSAFTKTQMTELLEPLSGGGALTGTVNWYLLLKKNGYHSVGEMVILSTVATRAVDEGRGTEVHVARCQDQREGRVVDKNGNTVTGDDFQLPEYNLRQYSVRKPTGQDKFRVFGYQTINGKCP